MGEFLEAKESCSSIGLIPTKSKGQNFLVNDKILEKIISAADLKSDDVVLEIGPGLGVLTEALAKKVKKVVAVELDKKLAAFLKSKFADQSNIEIIQGDILKFSLKSRVYGSKFKLVANLPYQITGAVLRKFLSPSKLHSDVCVSPRLPAQAGGSLSSIASAKEDPRQSASLSKPKLMVLMLQKEVAERIIDKNKKTAIISLVVNFYGQSKIAGFVSKNNFWPRPKVDSAILKIDLYKENKFGLDVEKEQDFIKVIKTGFAHPRKQVASNLSKNWPRIMVESALNQANKKANTRAEDIKIEDWYTIYRYLYESHEII